MCHQLSGWDYIWLNISSSKLSHMPSSYSPLNSCLLFFTDCYYMHMCICTYIHISKYNLHIFRVDRLALDNQLVWYALPWERLPLPIPAFHVAYSSLCRTQASWAFPGPLQHVHWCPCSAQVWAVVLMRFWNRIFTLIPFGFCTWSSFPVSVSWILGLQSWTVMFCLGFVFIYGGEC